MQNELKRIADSLERMVNLVEDMQKITKSQMDKQSTFSPDKIVEMADLLKSRMMGGKTSGK